LADGPGATLNVEEPGTESRHGRCPNCGVDRPGSYCARCGQSAADLNVSFGTLVREFVEVAFSVDSLFARTIAPLLTRPGHLTREFNAGRRVRYANPLRLYLVTSVAFFFVLALSSRDSSEPVQGSAEGTVVEIPVDRGTADSDSAAVRTDDDSVDAADGFRIRMERAAERARGNPGTFLGNLLRMYSYVMLVLVPVFAVYLKGLYFRHGRFYMEHLIFSLHFHTFLLIVLALVVPVRSTFPEDHPAAVAAAFVVILLVPLHLFLALRRVHPQPAWITGIKAALLCVGYAFTNAVASVSATLVTLYFFA
jgi:hypothetical protein